MEEVIPQKLKINDAVAMKVKGIKEPVMGFLAYDVACAVEYTIQEINYHTKKGNIKEERMQKILEEAFEALRG